MMVFAPRSISEDFLKIKSVDENPLEMAFIQKYNYSCSLFKLQGHTS